MLVSTDDADYIVHVVGTTLLHAQHIDMHEVGHLLLDHSTAIESVHTDNQVPALAEQAAVRALLPDLSPELIRRILGRTVYSNKQEREAELFASMLLSRTSRRVAGLGSSGVDFADRLTRLRSRAPAPADAAWAA